MPNNDQSRDTKRVYPDMTGDASQRASIAPATDDADKLMTRAEWAALANVGKVGSLESAQPARRRKDPDDRRKEILDAAMEVFGVRGYYNGSLGEIAAKVGITHSGILHHFGSKDNLLLHVMQHRDDVDVEHLKGQATPAGLDLFRHFIKTVQLNELRPGIVQTYTVLSAESVTKDHPGRHYFKDRVAVLRRDIIEALNVMTKDRKEPLPEDVLNSAAATIIAVMDGLQVQWLLDQDAIDMAGAAAFAIDAVLASALNHPEGPEIL